MYMPALALAIWYPHVGKLGALIAALSTMFVIYLLPLATYSKAVYVEQKLNEQQSVSNDTINDNEISFAEPFKFNINSTLSEKAIGSTAANQEKLLEFP